MKYNKVKLILMDDVHIEGRPKEMIELFQEEISNLINKIKNQNLIPIVVMAGDIGEGFMGFDFAKNFECDVVYVFGNHEFWNQDYYTHIEKSKAHIKKLEYKHIHFLYNNSIILHDIKFVGSTLWTDLGYFLDWDSVNYVIKNYYLMGDFKKIKAESWYTEENTNKLKAFLSRNSVPLDKQNELINNKMFNPLVELEENKKTKEYLNIELSSNSNSIIPTVVVTHHLPLKQMWVKKFKMKESALSKFDYNIEKNHFQEGGLNFDTNFLLLNMYTNDLKSLFIQKNSPNIWIHGHLHVEMDDFLNRTRICSSPVGYMRQSSVLKLKEVLFSENFSFFIQSLKTDIALKNIFEELFNILKELERVILNFQSKSVPLKNFDFKTILASFFKNYEHSKRDLNQRINYILKQIILYEQPQDPLYLEVEIKDKTNFTESLKKNFLPINLIPSLNLSIEVNSFLPNEEFNKIKDQEIYKKYNIHYSQWLKEIKNVENKIFAFKSFFDKFLNSKIK